MAMISGARFSSLLNGEFPSSSQCGKETTLPPSRLQTRLTVDLKFSRPGVPSDVWRPVLRRSLSAQMHLRLVAILTLVCNAIMMSSSARKRNAPREGPEDCRSCLECSRDNGCVRCPERLFLFLQRKGMTHHGACLHACPVGHFGQRGKDINRCMKCRSSDCERCFNKDFCTKCTAGFQLFKGKCYSGCPDGTLPHQTDCIEGCTLGPVGEWGEWTACLRNGLSCGFRWGLQTRTRQPSWTMPEEKASLCPSQSESRRCRMKKRCTKERRKNKRRGGQKKERKRLQLLTNGTVTEPPGGT